MRASRPIVVPLVIGIVVALVSVLGTLGPAPPTSASSADPTWSSYNSPYTFLGNQYPTCGHYVATAANINDPSPAGVANGTGFSLWETQGGGPACNQSGVQYVLAGTHTDGVFQPSQTGFYWVNASFSFSVVLSVWAQCGSATFSGQDLSSYAQTNVTAFVALYDDSQGSGWGVDSTGDQYFHLDSRAAYCAASPTYGDPNAAVFSLTLHATFKLECKGYLLSPDIYQPRAGVAFNSYVYVPSSGTQAGYSVAPQSTHTHDMAVINSITIAP